MRGYDAHFLVKAFAKSTGRINIIPQNYEKYLSFSLGGLVFKDSCQFLAGSLDTLAKNLNGETSITRTEISDLPELVRPLLLEKGEFPYSWFNSFDRFEETALPPAA